MADMEPWSTGQTVTDLHGMIGDEADRALRGTRELPSGRVCAGSRPGRVVAPRALHRPLSDRAP